MILALALAAPTAAGADASPAAAPPGVAEGLHRTDALLACPGIDRELQRELSHAVATIGKAGIAGVEFELRDGRVWRLGVLGGPGEYRPHLRRALRGFDCPAGRAGVRLRLIVRFEPHAGDEAPHGAVGVQAAR